MKPSLQILPAIARLWLAVMLSTTGNVVHAQP